MTQPTPKKRRHPTAGNSPPPVTSLTLEQLGLIMAKHQARGDNFTVDTGAAGRCTRTTCAHGRRDRSRRLSRGKSHGSWAPRANKRSPWLASVKQSAIGPEGGSTGVRNRAHLFSHGSLCYGITGCASPLALPPSAAGGVKP